MSEGRVLHKLLTNGEHDELEDVVIVEGEFVEVDENGKAIKQLILGLTPELLLMAERQNVNYKNVEADVNLELDVLELCSVFPICLTELNALRTKYGLIMTNGGNKRYFEMTNTPLNGDLEDRWYQWLDRVDYLHTDPYGYIRKMFDRYQLPYPSYLRAIGEVADEDVHITDHVVTAAVTNRENYKKQSLKKKRKGSKFIFATDFDTINEMDEIEIVEKKTKNRRRNMFCCIKRADD